MVIRATIFPMAALFMSLLGAMRSAFRTRAELALENLSLRQQPANLRHTSGRARLRAMIETLGLSLPASGRTGKDVIVVVKQDTVVA